MTIPINPDRLSASALRSALRASRGDISIEDLERLWNAERSSKDRVTVLDAIDVERRWIQKGRVADGQDVDSARSPAGLHQAAAGASPEGSSRPVIAASVVLLPVLSVTINKPVVASHVWPLAVGLPLGFGGRCWLGGKPGKLQLVTAGVGVAVGLGALWSMPNGYLGYYLWWTGVWACLLGVLAAMFARPSSDWRLAPALFRAWGGYAAMAVIALVTIGAISDAADWDWVADRLHANPAQREVAYVHETLPVRVYPEMDEEAADTLVAGDSVWVGPENTIGWRAVYLNMESPKPAGFSDGPFYSISWSLARQLAARTAAEERRRREAAEKARERQQALAGARAAAVERYVWTVVNLRSNPSIQSEVLDQLMPGRPYNVEVDDHGWSPVLDFAESSVDTLGYVSADLLHVRPEPSRPPAPRSAVTAGSRYELRSDMFMISIHSSRDWWDDRHEIARVPIRTEVDLLRRSRIEDAPGFFVNRCLIRTADGVRGWVFCDEVVRR